MTGGELERLESDLHVLSPVGLERAAWGWDRHERDSLQAYHAAERAALNAIEASDLGAAWEDFRRTLFGMTESRGALVSWRAEHGEVGHRAERAAFGAALGLFARDSVSHADYVALTRPMAEALPWLLPEAPPTPSA